MQQDDVTLAPDTLERLHRVSTATLTTQLLKNHGLRTRSVSGVKPVDARRCKFVGPAFTVRYVPMREDLSMGGKRPAANPLQEAIDNAPAGSVFVFDMNGDAGSGALGDILIARLIACGVAGVVADGGMRDIEPVQQMTLPVFCRGFAAPPSFASLLAADVQCPIGCGGVLVIPGDIVVAELGWRGGDPALPGRYGGARGRRPGADGGVGPAQDRGRCDGARFLPAPRRGAGGVPAMAGSREAVAPRVPLPLRA